MVNIISSTISLGLIHSLKGGGKEKWKRVAIRGRPLTPLLPR